MKTANYRPAFDGRLWLQAMMYGAAVCLATLLVLSHCGIAFGDDSPSDVSPDEDLLELNTLIQAGIQRAKPACVAVSQRRGGHAGFSAVIVGEEGHVFTAAHCIQPDREYYLHLDDGRTIEAKSLGRSDFLDIGLLQITEEADFPWVEMGTSADLIRNQPCLSISHPGGLNKKRGLVIRYGHVVGINDRGHIHNTCLMEPGDSGGGLFDLEGRLIGIHSYISRSLSDNFDMPVDHFRDHWEALCEPKEFTPAYAAELFGIGLESSTGTDEGAEVKSVVDDSPAADAGLQAGDVILSMNESEVNAEFKIARELRRLKMRRGNDLNMTIGRDDQELAIVISTQQPPPQGLAEGESEQYDSWSDLARVIAPVEEVLDDFTVRIVSSKANEDITVLGTVLSQDGLILSKASRVGESPTVTDCDDRELPAEVVGRDKENDLILLRVDAQFELAVDFDLSSEEATGMLLSPRPGEEGGSVSVVGSAGFVSPLQAQNGYLGVMPVSQDGRVALSQVPDGPAKEAGIEQGDFIVSVDDKAIESVDELISTIRSYDPEETVRVTIQRDSQEKVIEVVLGIRPQNTGSHVAYQFAGGGSTRRTGFEEVFCHDAHVEPADCGGPLFDLNGDFIGMNIARYSRTRCYALPAEVVRKSVDRLSEGSL